MTPLISYYRRASRLLFTSASFLLLSLFSLGQTPPTAVEDEIYTWDNVFTSGDLSDNDLNPDNSILTYEMLSSTPHGELIVLPNGEYTFNPYPEVSAVNQKLTYEVCDNFGQCDIDTIRLYVAFHNDPPQAEADLIYVEIDTPRFGNASENDFDPDYLSDPVSTINSYSAISLPLHGTVIFNLDGTLEYTPDPGFVGQDSMLYLNCDACTVCDIATIFFEVIPNNEDPVAVNSLVIGTNEDASYFGTIAPLVTDPENDPLTYSVLFQPDNGMVVMNNNGTFLYTPEPNYTGADDFMFLACDIVGQCGVATFSFNVINQNDPPIVGDESFTINEDFPSFNGNASLNDNDDTGTINYSLISDPLHGTAIVNNNGTFTYVPDLNYNGNDTIYLNACDLNGLCVTDMVVMTITPLNDWPMAVLDDLFHFEDQTLNSSIANDIDVDGDNLTYTFVSGGSGGDLTISSNGDITFVPANNFSGFYNATYQVCDQNAACSQGSIIIEIIEINDDPIVNSDIFSGVEDQIITGNVFLNDIEPDGESMYFFTISNPSNGTLQFNANGTFTYTPFANWSGSEVISFYGCDPCSVCGLATLTINVAPSNDSPEAEDITEIIDEDNSITDELSDHTTDIDNEDLEYSIADNPSHGSLTISPAGVFTYIPESNYSGTDSFVYSACDEETCDEATVTIIINAINDAPIAIDDEDTTNEDSSVSGSLNNDIDLDNDPLVFEIISNPMNGAINIESNGNYEYTPDPDFNGVDMITYEVCDGIQCDAGVLVITVSALNDAPSANNAVNVTYQNSTLNGSLISDASDIDGDDITFTLVSPTSNGTITITPDGDYIYNPDLDYSGMDQASFEVCDESDACTIALLDITIFMTNSAPTATDNALEIEEDILYSGNLNDNVTDPQGGQMTFNLLAAPSNGTLELSPFGNFTYTPAENYHGSDNFTYEVCDTGGMCDEASVTITINSVNDFPIAFDDTYTALEGTSINGNVSSNDSDNDSNALTFASAANGLPGILTFQQNGEFNFAPEENFYGNLIITYSVCDDFDACTEGQISIEYLSVNDSPLASEDSFETNEDEILSGTVANNDTDIDLDILEYSVITYPAHGMITLSDDGDFSYLPDANFNGADSYEYQVCDPYTACASALVNINIISINDSPVLTDDYRTINEDHTAEGNVTLNDIDVDDATLTCTLINGAQNGTLSFSSDGSFFYTPNENYSGNEEITFSVCDAVGSCSVSTLYIIINSENDSPQATNLETFAVEDNTVSDDLNNYVSDPDNSGSDFSFEIVTQPTSGSVTVNSAGIFTYSPSDNFNGLDEFTYEICDPYNACTTGIATITIAPSNDAPFANREYIHVLEDSYLEDDLSINDEDIDGDALSYSIINNALHGSFELLSNGEFVYTPELNFWGMDSVTYVACDPSFLCAESTIVFEVDFVNDAPIVVNEAIEVIMNTSVSGTVADNEIELDFENLTYFIYQDNSNGLFTLNEDGTYEYTPFENVTGTFELIYYACDPCSVCSEGVLTIYVVSEKDVNSAPIALDNAVTMCAGGIVEIDMTNLASDVQDASFMLNYSFDENIAGTISLDPETKILTYTGEANNLEPIEIIYNVCDNGLVPLCDEGIIAISFTPEIIPSLTSVEVENISCFGQNDGSIDITVDGSDNMSFMWNNDQNTQDIMDLVPGDYSVVVNSTENCFQSQTYNFTVTQPAQLNSNIVGVIDISDINQGEIAIDIIGGTQPYFITWTGPENYTSNEEDITNLSVNGDYSAVITDANNCNTSVSTEITSINEIDFSLFSVSPNPFADQFTITCHDGKINGNTIEVFDASGKLVESLRINNMKQSYNMKHLADGCYWLKIQTDKNYEVVQLVKQ